MSSFETGENIRIGTRDSLLAMVQAEKVQALLQKAFPKIQTQLVPMKTTGDIDLKSSLHEIGGKGVFIKELEQALLQDHIDIAVHSLKDVTSTMPAELHICAYLKAEANADVLVFNNRASFSDLREGDVIATGSLRRKALIAKLYPHLKTEGIRGNVQTRMKRFVERGHAALMLSEAGLIRLNLQKHIGHTFDTNTFIPAPGQGVIAIQCRQIDDDITALCTEIGDHTQGQLSRIEMGFLKEVGFDCRLPLGLNSTIEKGQFHTRLFMANEAMDKYLEEDLVCSVEEAKGQVKSLAKRCIAWSASN